MKKKLSLFLALVMAFVLLMSACGTKDATETASAPNTEAPETVTEPAEEEETESALAAEIPATSDETLRVCLSEEPTVILPLLGNAAHGNYVAMCLYDTLVYFNSDTGELEPRLATEWEWLDDTHLQLKLRDDVVAMDGTILNANDVMYSLQAGLAGDAKTYWKYIDGDECSVVDEFTFVLGLTEAHPTIISMLANINMLAVIDESSVEANGGYEACARNPKCATGPYVFDEWKSGEYIRLVRNEDYWGEPSYYKTIEFTFINDSTSRTMTIASGDADFCCDITNANTQTVLGYEGCKVYNIPSGGCYVIFFNVTNEYLSNPLIREAIFYAVDTNALNMIASTGANVVADSIMPHTLKQYSAADESYNHVVDIEKSKTLLTEAGYPDGFDLQMPVIASQMPVAEAIQACLAQVGINLKVDVVELPVYLGATDTGDFDICYQRSTPDDISNMLNYFDDRLELNQRGGGIIGGYEDMYDIIDTCRYTTDETASLEGWSEFQDYIRENYLYIPAYEDTKYIAGNGEYTVQYNPIGYTNFSTCRPLA